MILAACIPEKGYFHLTNEMMIDWIFGWWCWCWCTQNNTRFNHRRPYYFGHARFTFDVKSTRTLAHSHTKKTTTNEINYYYLVCHADAALCVLWAWLQTSHSPLNKDWLSAAWKIQMQLNLESKQSEHKKFPTRFFFAWFFFVSVGRLDVWIA